MVALPIEMLRVSREEDYEVEHFPNITKEHKAWRAVCFAWLDDVPRRALSPCRPMFVIEEKADDYL